MEFGNFLGRGTDVVGGVAGYEEVDFGGIVFLWRSGGGIGIDVDIPMVLAGRGEGTMGEVGIVGAAVSPDADGVILERVGEGKREPRGRGGRRRRWSRRRLE